jgi:hypothetical protein
MEEDMDPPVLPTQEPIPTVPDPAAHPTLEEYRARWAEKLEAYAKPAGGGYSSSNLVPKPIPNLWQDCTSLSLDAKRRSLFELSACLNNRSLCE